MVAMLSRPNLRILLEFSSGGTIPELDVRLGANGIGATLPEHCSLEIAAGIAQNVARRAAQQKAFAFLGGLSSQNLVHAVSKHQIRFGMGCALVGGVHYTGLENVPDVPLCGRTLALV